MFIAFILLFLSLGFSHAAENCDSLGVLLYEDIGCKPVNVEGKACPVEYKCDDFAANNATCLFRSKILKSGEVIDDALVDNQCRLQCTCNAEQDIATNGIFTCHTPDCPEWKPENQNLAEGCYNSYDSVRQCCASGTKCKSDKTVATCQGKTGRTHYEGQTMDALDCSTCSDCLCRKGSDGKGEVFCKRQNCLVQLGIDSYNLVKYCAPVYLSSRCPSLCCPDSYACPTDTDVVQRFTNVEDSGLRCKFGTRTLKLGEGVETTTYKHSQIKVKCECVLPPLLTCRKSTK